MSILEQLDMHYSVKRDMLQGLADLLNGLVTDSPPFHSKRPFPALDAVRIPKRVVGPRLGQLRLYPGTHGTRLHKLLSASNCAAIRALFSQLDGWRLEGTEPRVYFDGDALVIEAVWPAALQLADIPLADWMHPRSGHAVIIGLSQFSEVIAVHLDNRSPHMLIAGRTGSGKSWLLRSVVYQLAADPRAEFVLLDGKGAEGLGPLNGMPGQVGPVALTDSDQLRALCWVLALVNERNAALGQAQLGNGTPGQYNPVYVVFDEFQTLLETNRDAAWIVSKLAKEARSANVHLVFATQYPTEDMWGGTGAKSQFDTRIALRLTDWYQSNVALGSGYAQRANELLGCGDALVVAEMPRVAARIRRVQCVYVPPADIYAKTRAAGLPTGAPAHAPRLRAWPAYEPAAFREETRGANPTPFTAAEAVVALWAAMHDVGQPTAMTQMERVLGHALGSTRYAERFVPLGEELRAVWEQLEERTS